MPEPDDRRPLRAAPLRPQPPVGAVALLLIGAYAVLFLGLPVRAWDTDLWYHLNSGRYAVAHGTPPDHSFFSFLDPARPWVDYFWLFQVLVYGVHAGLGYPGLVLLRAALFTAALVVAARIYPVSEGADRFGLGRAVFVALLAQLLYHRYSLVRPHTVSYLLIAVFLLVLERHRRWTWVLPGLAVLWANVHGITYPVMYAVVGAYLFEGLWQSVRGRKTGPWKERAALGLCFPAVLATPHGWKLFSVPFVSTHFASQYIAELGHTPLEKWLSASVEGLVADPNAVFLLLAGAALSGLWGEIRARRLRPAHAVLFVAAAALVVRGARFRYEFILLSLPLIVSAGGIPALGRAAAARWCRAALVGAVVFLVTAAFFRAVWADRGAWPFDPRGLPVGVCRFLVSEAAGGRVLQHPNNGGYYQWALGDRFRIYMDMEVPFLFTDEDMFVANHVFSDPEVFGRVADRYRPAFVAVPLGAKDFEENVLPRYRNYRPVFFDQAAVLFADADQEPDLVARYELREVRPFDLAGRKVDELLEGVDERAFVEELERILAVHPENGLANQVMALWLLRQGDAEGALEHARRVVRWFPASPRGHKLVGDALRALKRFPEALAAYEAAAQRSAGPIARAAWRQMGLIYAEREEPERAYEYFSRAILPYDASTGWKDLYFLGTAALLANEPAQAQAILRFARIKLPPGETAWRERIERQLRLSRGEAP